MPAVSAEAKSLAKDLLSFVDASPTPFQVVSVVSSRLASAGFVELKEIDNWAARGLVQKNGKVSRIASWIYHHKLFFPRYMNVGNRFC
jgi:aspartyl aminopeptidase